MRDQLTRPRGAIGAAAIVLLAVALGTAGCSSHSGGTAAGNPSITAPAGGTSGEPVATLSRSTPTNLTIPAIGVDTSLVRLGLNKDKTMQVPTAGFPAGWYSGAPTPGQVGPAIIVGHINWAGKDGVFVRLHELKPGDEVTITRADRTTAIFRVTQEQEIAKADFPTGAVYGNVDHSALRLITCGGAFDAKVGHYVDNIIVYADLVSTRAA